MTTRTRLEPGPDHPITIARTAGHVVVRVGDQVIAESDNAPLAAMANAPLVLPAVIA